MGISMKTTSGKLLASAALVATAAGVAGLGTYGAFTDSTAADQKVAAGTVDIDLGAGSGSGFDVMATDVLPGDTIERVVTLTNNGSSNLNSIFLTTSAAEPASPLTTDTVNGLKLTVERCAEGWTGSVAPYKCAGTPQIVLGPSHIIGSQQLNNLQSLTAKKSDSLKVTAVLPKEAGNSFQNAASTVNFLFDATQRTAVTK
ncbi:TasA family protein [Arthrobacter crystallopoietes]|uniref:TasA family protein n=1 Tax=Crystallibacter crystallopoietes TaxID=37928 RepID=UPI001F116F1F|nr:TasA family protein [Arthrobacter crystallopoietes]